MSSVLTYVFIVQVIALFATEGAELVNKEQVQAIQQDFIQLLYR